MEMKISELKNGSAKLQQSTSELKNTFETSLKTKANDAYEVFKKLDTRSDSVLKQAEQVTNDTQRLLDNANNAFESLNRINQSLTGRLFVPSRPLRVREAKFEVI